MLVMKPGKNDPCWCRSGKKYKKCHMNFDKLRSDVRLDRERRDCAEKWNNSSRALSEQNAYAWMADKLVKSERLRIFDIGCGNGNGLVEICRAASNNGVPRIVSIDENYACLAKAKEALMAEGIKTSLARRLQRWVPTGLHPSLALVLKRGERV